MELKRGYKETEVGVIPVEWQVKCLGDLGTIVRGGSPRPAGDPRFFNGNFVPWLTVAALTNIPDSQLFVSETLGFLTQEGSKRSRTLAEGTVIIANSGATLGVAKILGITCCANDGIAAIINQKGGDKSFICQYINSRTAHLREVVATGNGQPNLNTTLIGRMSIPFPSDDEQRAIAAALSDVDALLAKLDQLITKKRDMKQGAMQELLTGQRRLPGFDGQWQRLPLGKVGSFSKGAGIKKDQVLHEGIPCVRYGELYTHHNDHIRQFYSFISSEIARESHVLRTGDLLFAGSGETAEEIGKCVAFLGTNEAYAGGDIVIFSPRHQDSMYLGYLMNHPSIVAQKARMGQGDAVVHISARNLATLEVILPERAEQVAIATVVSDMDDDIAALEARRDKARALKQGMMQELLTGRIRLA
jgi:type I restriction enzyme S subunit